MDPNEVILELDSGWAYYFQSKVGEQKVIPSFRYDEFGGSTLIHKACDAAQKLETEYDLGLAIARDGLWLGYIFDKHGWPVNITRMHRSGGGATWQPIDFTEEDIKGKRVLVLDSDTVTGRTIKTAVSELQKLGPESVGVLLMYDSVPIMVDTAKSILSDFDIRPALFDGANKVLELLPTSNGLELKCQIGNGAPKIEYYGDGHYLWLKCEANVPEGIKAMSLQRNFDPSAQAVVELGIRMNESSINRNI